MAQDRRPLEGKQKLTTSARRDRGFQRKILRIGEWGRQPRQDPHFRQDDLSNEEDSLWLLMSKSFQRSVRIQFGRK